MSFQIRNCKCGVSRGPQLFNPTPVRGPGAGVVAAGGSRFASGPGVSSPAGRAVVAAGDPGLFGFVGDLFGGAAKAVGSLALSAVKTTPLGGLIAGVGGGLLSRIVSSSRTPSITPQRAPQQITVRPGVGEVAMFSQDLGNLTFGPQEVVPKPGVRGAIERFLPGGSTGLMVAPGQAGVGAPSGFHVNKSSYFLRDGTFVPAGSRFVRNRRRNALNPRALDRAMGRITSAKKAAKKLGRITIRKKC